MARKSLSLVLLALSLSLAEAWAEPVSPASHIAVAPDLAVNEQGDMALLWVDRAPELRQDNANHDRHLSYTDLYVSISRDGGKSFGQPVKVNHGDGVVWGQSVSRPRIAGSTDGTWHVSYAANEIHPVLNKPTLTSHYTRSTDGGETFEPPRRLSTLTDVDMSDIIHGGFTSASAFQTLATAPDGNVHVAWIDTRFMTPEQDTGALFTAVSHDNGSSFDGDKQLLEAGVCPCCQLTATADENSNMYLGLRLVSADGFRQSTVARMKAGAASLEGMADAGSAPWQINGCPLKPTVLATRGETVFTAVYSGGEENPGVYFSHSNDGGRSFTKSVAAHPDALVSDAPSVAVNGTYVLLAWHGKTDGPRRVFYRMYDLKGEAVGGITELEAEPGNAQNPVVTVRADGKFQIAWQQTDRIYTDALPGTPDEVEVGLR